MSQIQCPRCGNTVADLQNIDPTLAERLKKDGIADSLPPAVCSNCFTQLAGSIGRGGIIHVREKAREQKKLMLWKSRVNLIKKARHCMSDKKYSEAAVQYEKYIKVLEVVFDSQPGQLSPEKFKDSARTQELTVVASVYWDLLRIYDTSEKYGERMNLAGKKLAQFLRFTPIFPDIMRKAESFSRTAKNPTAIKAFLKAAKEGKGRCFIATSAFENAMASEVIILQNWRDFYLYNRWWGTLFVKLYYVFSPPIAYLLDTTPLLKPLVRRALRLFINRAIRH